MRSELLAPAGSFESMKAAFAAGADAVYIGGKRFGARAYADNLDEEMMKRAIDHAHLKGKKLYLTVNTLLKDAELDSLYDYLNPFYREGLDAVLLQDFGVVSMVKNSFPGMEIHASTQMSITTEYGAQLLKEEGASRIVTARELSLEEIKTIYRKTGMEIECFIHGALCFCYSGQCLLSSMLGGRSGNRGRCAQPCRLPYEWREKGRTKTGDRYLLSPKDICTLDILPDILESGVYSLKIEGRMKKPEYVAGVVSIYRKYLNLLEEKGKKNYRVSKEDKRDLLDLYNRGGFSSGYYRQQNGPDMMSTERPNHQGTVGAKILSADKGGLKVQALEMLHKGDVLESLDSGAKLQAVVQEEVRVGKAVRIKPQGHFKIPEKEDILYRTRNEQLLNSLEKNYIAAESPEKINGKLILSKRKSAILTLSVGEHVISVEGPCPEAAQKHPLTKTDVEKQIKKTGGTDFVFETLQTEMEPDLFLPLQSLNELRRTALDQLKKVLLQPYGRPDGIRSCRKEKNMEMPFPTENNFRLAVSLENADMADALCKIEETDALYLDCNAFRNASDLVNRGRSITDLCKNSGKECFYIMPWIFRQKAVSYYLQSDVKEVLSFFDGILIRNPEEYMFLKEIGYGGRIAADWNLYTWNREAQNFWREKGLEFDTISPELNRREIAARGCRNSELIVYGYQPLMVSAQCQIKNHLGCTGKPQVISLTDRKKKSFFVKNNCQFCYNTLYNGVVTELADCEKIIRSMNPFGVRLQFTTEKQEKVLWVVQRYIDILKHGCEAEENTGEFTRGHFERGVE